MAFIFLSAPVGPASDQTNNRQGLLTVSFLGRLLDTGKVGCKQCPAQVCIMRLLFNRFHLELLNGDGSPSCVSDL